MSRHQPRTRAGRRFDGLLDNLRLTARQRDDGNGKWRGVVQRLNQLYYNSTSEDDHSALLGSWGKRTAIRPPSDVDVLFVLPSDLRNRYRGTEGINVQSYILQLVKKRLAGFYPDTALRGTGPVIFIPFSTIHVEVLPAFAYGTEGGRFQILNTADGGSYKTVNPRAELRNMENANRRSEANTRDLIRMAKCWKYFCSVPIKSFCLELLAIDFLDQWEKAPATIDRYPQMVRQFFAYIVRRGNGRVSVPGANETIWLEDKWVSRAVSAYKRSTNAELCETEQHARTAGEWWQMVFGRYIPLE